MSRCLRARSSTPFSAARARGSSRRSPVPLGDFDVAEEALQEACAAAAIAWPRDGLPHNGGAWSTTTARRKAFDILRRRRPAQAIDADELAAPDAADDREESDGGAVKDERLRLLFLCCHPAIAPRNQVTLALKTLCGLATREIARAFVEDEATCAQRLVRTKAKIFEAGISMELPSPTALVDRTAAVLMALHLMFNEGYVATFAEGLMRADVCREAIRLAALVAELLPTMPAPPDLVSPLCAEAKGLAALMTFHDARRAARTDDAGDLIPLEEQDRRLWDRSRIAAARALLGEAWATRTPGPYQLQAAIAALHCEAARAEETDWPQIAALYGLLVQHNPTAIARLNAAVAAAFALGLERGLAAFDRLDEEGELAGYHLLPAARADVSRRAGRYAEAVRAYDQAIALVTNPAERAYLERRRATCNSAPPGDEQENSSPPGDEQKNSSPPGDERENSSPPE